MISFQMGCMIIADMLGLGEHGRGPLHSAARKSHHGHGPPPHHDILGVLAGVFVFVAVFHVVKRCCRRRKQPSILSQLSQLSAQSDTIPNPLLAGRHTLAAGSMQAAGGVTKSEPEWMINVPWSDWQIDQQDITLCHRPDGRLWELGAGASAKVWASGTAVDLLGDDCHLLPTSCSHFWSMHCPALRAKCLEQN